MHIAILNYPFAPGVTDPAALLERFHALSGWAEALAAAGAARVTVLQRFPADAELRRGAVTYRFVRDGYGPLPRSWQIPRRMHRMAAGLRADLTHLNGQIFPLQCHDLRRGLPRGCALLVQHHGGDPPDGRGLRGALHLALARLGLRTADGFLFTSLALAQPWRAAGLIRPRQAVYPALEASTALRPPPAAPRLRGSPALLWVGRLHPVKDPLTVLEGFALARRAMPGAALTMVYGSEELLPAVRARCAAPDLAGAVDLLGRRPQADLPALYAGADLFVLGSRREGTCFALLEALACGLTPVLSHIPGFAALAGDLGQLWHPGDARGCAEAICRAAAGDQAAGRAAALAHFERHLSWPAVARSALAAYAAAVARRAGDD